MIQSSMIDSNMQDVRFYCDAPLAMIDDVPTEWCDWQGSTPALLVLDTATSMISWVCPSCDWEWVATVEPRWEQ